ncbi:MAG: DUF2783 domain-containing protein [Myxococcota bacterium]
MAHLKTEPHLARPDDFYEKLLALHKGCSDAESHRRNAKLVLALANHIGDLQVLEEALDLARGEPSGGD